MLSLGPDETELKGEWQFLGDRRLEDDVCRRIRMLVTSELEFLAADTAGCHSLYRDPFDSRLWELTEGEAVPPRLRLISAVEAKEKYKIAS